jgi:hypothetical protein
MKNLIVIGIMILISLSGSGCLKEGQESNSNMNAKALSPTKIVIMALDDTGSYKNWEKAKQVAKEIVVQLQPGDVFYLRKITGESYTDRCSLFRLEIPKIESSDFNNPFDRKAKKARRLSQKRINILKRAAINKISELKPSSAGSTDLNGFFAAADEKFALFKGPSVKILCIASDLQENVRYKPDLEFKGVYVAVVGFQPMKDPKRTQKFKKNWQSAFNKYGVKKTAFYRTDEKFNINNL